MTSMLKKLTVIGSSKGLILDKTLLGLLGIENAEVVSITVEGKRLIVTPAYESPIEELRARRREAGHEEAIDAAIDAASRKTRPATVRKLKAGRSRRRS
jgi:antitoxin component of MazEF toxin-antitoxin module